MSAVIDVDTHLIVDDKNSETSTIIWELYFTDPKTDKTNLRIDTSSKVRENWIRFGMEWEWSGVGMGKMEIGMGKIEMWMGNGK